MTLQIGRVGLSPAWTDSLETYRRVGDMLEIRGEIWESTTASSEELRAQLLGHVEDGAEPMVPLIWSEHAEVDGFYELLAADVDAVTMSLTSGIWLFSASLRRLGSESGVEFESLLTGAVLANDHGIASGSRFHAPPRGHYAFDPGGTLPTVVTRAAEGGNLTVYTGVAGAVIPAWSVAPADYYNEAAQISVDGVVRTGLDAVHAPSSWQLENGLVRVTPTGANGSIDVEHYDGSQWETAKAWAIKSGGSHVGEWDAVTICRNDPAECVIRLTRNVSGGGRLTLDLALRRGSRFVTGYLTRYAAATLKVVRASTEAGTAGTGFVRATSNDGDGNRYVVGCSQDHTADTTEGGLSIDSTTTLDFFIGSEIAGSGAQSGDAAADLVNQYLAYASESTRAVRR